MAISAISFSGVRSVNKFPKKAKKIKEEMPDFFRDKELFDLKKDVVSDEYFEYNPSDVKPSKPYYTENVPYQQVIYDYVRDMHKNNL